MPDWLWWLVAVAITIVTVRATVRFDVNEWLRDRRRQKEEKLRSLCPHAVPTIHDGKPAIRGMYVSPSGTTAYHCQLCGDVMYDPGAIDEVMAYWGRNPDKLLARNKEIEKLMKKLGRG